MIAIALIAISCEKSGSSSSEEKKTLKEVSIGVFLLCEEGINSLDNAKLDYIDYYTENISTDIFSTNNGGKNLGMGVTDISPIPAGNMAITSDWNNTVTIVNAYGVVQAEEKRPTGYTPQSVCTDTAAFYIGYKEGIIERFSESGNSIIGGMERKEFNVGKPLTEIIYTDGKIFALHGKEIGVYDGLNMKPISTISFSDEVVKIEIDKYDELYALTKGSTVAENRIHRINRKTYQLISTFNDCSVFDFSIGGSDLMFVMSYEKDKDIKVNHYDVKTDEYEGEYLLSFANELTQPTAIIADPFSSAFWICENNKNGVGMIYLVREHTKIGEFLTGGRTPSKMVFCTGLIEVIE